MKKILNTLVIALTVVMLVSSCNSTKIMTDINPTTDFKKVKTYEIVFQETTEQSIYINDLNNNRIEKAIDLEMNKRGLKKSAKSADVQIHVLMGIQESKSYSANTTHMGDPYMGRRYYGMGYSTTTMNEYTTNIGNLTLTMRDAKTGELMWYVTAEKELKGKQKNQQARINEAMSKLLEEFPIAVVQ